MSEQQWWIDWCSYGYPQEFKARIISVMASGLTVFLNEDCKPAFCDRRKRPVRSCS